MYTMLALTDPHNRGKIGTTKNNNEGMVDDNDWNSNSTFILVFF